MPKVEKQESCAVARKPRDAAVRAELTIWLAIRTSQLTRVPHWEWEAEGAEIETPKASRGKVTGRVSLSSID